MTPVHDTDLEEAFGGHGSTAPGLHPYSFEDAFFEIIAQPPMQVSYTSPFIDEFYKELNAVVHSDWFSSK